MSQITKQQTNDRTETMLEDKWNVEEITQLDNITDFGKTSASVAALKGTIENFYFKDVDCKVYDGDLLTVVTVNDLSTIIWNGIPLQNQISSILF